MELREIEKKTFEEAYNKHKADPKLAKKVENINLKESLIEIDYSAALDFVQTARPEIEGISKKGFVVVRNITRGSNNGLLFKQRMSKDLDNGKLALENFDKKLPEVRKNIAELKKVSVKEAPFITELPFIEKELDRLVGIRKVIG